MDHDDERRRVDSAPSPEASRTSLETKLAQLENELRTLKRRLAKDRGRPDSLQMPLEALVFRIGTFAAALQTSEVAHLSPMVLVSPLPNAPPGVRGTVNYRGAVVPVLDLDSTVAGVPRPLTPDLLLLFTSDPENRFALVLDEVQGVSTFEQSDVSSSVTMVPDFVIQVLRMAHSSVAVLAPQRLLAGAELGVLREQLAASIREAT